METYAPTRPKRRRRWLRGILLFAAGLVAAFYALCLTGLILLRSFNPPTTMVQTQRRVEAWLHRKPYQKRAT